MSLHFSISKFNPATQEKTLLHRKVPEELVDWLCGISERELSRQEREQGFAILKESLARPVEIELFPSHKPPVWHEQKVAKTKRRA